MKQFKIINLLFFLNIFAIMFVDGQSLIVPGKTWTYLLADDIPEFKIINEECLQVGSDTLIQNTIYYKLMYSLGCNETDMRIKGFIRETNDRLVFYLPNNSSANEFLLYNFGIHVGDSVFSTPIPSRLDSIRETAKGQKIYYLSGIDHFKDTWIEGVGSETGLLMELITGGSLIFTCCLLNGENLYQNPEYNTCFYTSAAEFKNAFPKLKIYPNPATNELFIQTSQGFDEDCTLQLFSLKGELLKTRCLDAGTSLYRFGIGEFKSGTYILRLISDSGKYEDNQVVIKK